MPGDSFFLHAPPAQYASVAHSSSLAHAVVHAPALQRNGAHSVPPVTALHVPAPSHCCATTRVSSHVVAPQLVPPAAYVVPAQEARVVPSHRGVAHALPAPQAVRTPCGAPVTAAQVPSAPAVSHASHWPVQAALQQKPSTHSALVHAPPRAQAWPLASRGLHVPASQNAPGCTQSVSTAHVVVQVPAVHKNGAQSIPVALVVHVPRPSQTLPDTDVPVQTFPVPHATPAVLLTTPAQLVVVVPSHAGD